MRDQAAMRRGAFASTSCPICLDDFEDDAAAARRAAAGPSGSGGDPAAAAAAAAAARAGAAGSTTSAAAAGEASKSGGAEVRQRKVGIGRAVVAVAMGWFAQSECYCVPAQTHALSRLTVPAARQAVVGNIRIRSVHRKPALPVPLHRNADC